MKIALIQVVYYEYLGVMYLSSSLKKHGHTVEAFIYRRGNTVKTFIEEIKRFKPDIAAFSCMTGSEEQLVSLARQLKNEMDVYTVFGGPHPTAVPEIIEREGVDCVCQGEAEQSLVAIADILARGGIPATVPGAWFKINREIVRNESGTPEQNLEKLPRPDRSLYREKYPSMRTQRAGFLLGRGCPYHCTFCASPSWQRLYHGKGNFVRQQSVQAVIEEMREVKAKYNIRTVYFFDDTFIINRDWVLEFCDAYRHEIGLPFSCNIRADLATEELIAALARANCKTTAFGVETGNSENRKRLLKKDVSDEQIINCSELLRAHGIRFRTFNMLGLPGETLDDAFQTIALNVKIKSDYPWCSLYQPLPGTELGEYCRKNGMFNSECEAPQPSFFKGSSLELENRNEIVNLQKLFFFAVKFPRLQSSIRRAIRLRPNAFFEFFFVLAHARNFYRLELFSLQDMVNIGMRNVEGYLPRGRG